MAPKIRGRAVMTFVTDISAMIAATGCIPELAVVDGKIFGNGILLAADDAARFGQASSPGVGVRIRVAKRGDVDAPRRRCRRRIQISIAIKPDQIEVFVIAPRARQ